MKPHSFHSLEFNKKKLIYVKSRIKKNIKVSCLFPTSSMSLSNKLIKSRRNFKQVTNMIAIEYISRIYLKIFLQGTNHQRFFWILSFFFKAEKSILFSTQIDIHPNWVFILFLLINFKKNISAYYLHFWTKRNNSFSLSITKS